MRPLHRFLISGGSGEEEQRGIFKYEHLHVLCFHCGHIGHAMRDCVHPETFDANMNIIGYGP